MEEHPTTVTEEIAIRLTEIIFVGSKVEATPENVWDIYRKSLNVVKNAGKRAAPKPAE